MYKRQADGGEYTNNNPYSTYGFYYGGAGENKEKKYNLIATAYAQYNKDFNKGHHLDVMVGYEYNHMKYWGGDVYKRQQLGYGNGSGRTSLL